MMITQRTFLKVAAIGVLLQVAASKLLYEDWIDDIPFSTEAEYKGDVMNDFNDYEKGPLLHTKTEEYNEDFDLPSQDFTKSTDYIEIMTISIRSEPMNGAMPPGTISKTSKVPHDDQCPIIGAKQEARSFVKCQCQGDEILKDGRCHHYNETRIPVQYDLFLTREESTENRKVIIKEVHCDSDLHLYREFTKGQFQIRDRGDIVLLESAGDLAGQRINDYCLSHHLDNEGELTWTIKACVPIPSIPRCCPYGFAMKDGECKEAKTPRVLTPPVAAKPFGDPVEWPIIHNYDSTLKCHSLPMKTIPIGYKQSNLVSLADGVENGWVPEVPDKRRVYHGCPEYCVDGIENYDGTVNYFTSFCYRDPIEVYKEACSNSACIQKCCKDGQSMDKNKYSCVPDANATFSPPTAKDVSSYKIIVGWPLCGPINDINKKINIDENGNLYLKEEILPSSDFCVDTFLDNGHREQSGLVCVRGATSKWMEVRPTVFSICNAISLFFLSIIILSHLFVPELLKDGGMHVLCYAISLSIAYASSLTVHVFHDYFTNLICINNAFVMQFGFLATFFWLNVKCFEICRTIWRIKNYRLTTFYPNRYYMLYGWGIPSCFCIATILMQYMAPDNAWDEVKPYIGISRCWFRGDIALLIYFYGPIAFVCICNTLLLSFTWCNTYVMMKLHREGKEASKLKENKINQQRKGSTERPSDVGEPLRNFVRNLIFFTLMATCWVTELLSWKIPFMELWSVTDTVNSLQGLLLFILILLNHNKRRMIFGCSKNSKLLCQKKNGSVWKVDSSNGSAEGKILSSPTFNTLIGSVKCDLESSESAALPKDCEKGDVFAISYAPLKSSKPQSDISNTLYKQEMRDAAATPAMHDAFNQIMGKMKTMLYILLPRQSTPTPSKNSSYEKVTDAKH